MFFSLQKKTQSGFTIIELLVSISIFAFMTAFLVVKYGTFNQSVLLTNLAYDSALTIRTAQSYGLNVQGTATSSTALGFGYAYGVHFDSAYPTKFIFFVDLCGDDIYRVQGATTCAAIGNAAIGNEVISTYTMRTGFELQPAVGNVGGLCAGTSVTCSQVSSLDITFRRPYPDALIFSNGAGVGTATPVSYAKIPFLSTSDGSMKFIVVQSTGQIAVVN